MICVNRLSDAATQIRIPYNPALATYPSSTQETA
ncbi:hypothetical protein PSP20601_00029 [Pandoraea sputorum]|uniref:Uncharacterized protein n=1 Tax=Pandoraea sputorum TaxID=93222 RepID=A0A239SBH1_9BURK|nr:Uncharacterised protein [Pandoraea sputorum]VVD59629.1 hypothetical protein PSP20601_00029 [Pandoraea sputorum]